MYLPILWAEQTVEQKALSNPFSAHEAHIFYILRQILINKLLELRIYGYFAR